MRRTPGAAWRPRRTATPGVVATHRIVATRRAVAMRQQRGTLQLRCGALTPEQRCDVVRCAAASEQQNCATKLRTVKGRNRSNGRHRTTSPQTLCPLPLRLRRIRRGGNRNLALSSRRVLFVCLFVCWGSCLCDRSAPIAAAAVSGSASFSKGRMRCSTSTCRGTACRRAPDRSRCGSGCRCLTSAVLYRTLRYSTVRCGTLRYSAVLCGTLRLGLQVPHLCGTLRYSAVLGGTLRYSTVLYGAVCRRRIAQPCCADRRLYIATTQQPPVVRLALQCELRRWVARAATSAHHAASRVNSAAYLQFFCNSAF